MARILVVDDVKEAVDAIRKILEKRGHEVIGYTDEEAAIDHVNNQPVDLAILDIKLKNMDGVEILGRLIFRSIQLSAVSSMLFLH